MTLVFAIARWLLVESKSLVEWLSRKTDGASTFASDAGLCPWESVRMQHHCHVISVVALGMATLIERRKGEGSAVRITSSR